MASKLLQKIKERRQELNIRVSHMPAHTGLGREQYSAIERGGNPTLSNLERIAEGLQAEVMLIPKELVSTVEALISNSGRMDNDTNL
ncbi:transcriptional regulator with XRE-family HTH domain [Pseudomonas nitritireducens]|uniref:Transcriptional regulator with XRE-family HTH domain n=1 Tax=Pseudomonas nitroreducens TaxID=46680 RepID=A0A7W7P4Z4_PSENT|nr:helix-turn-helix transcriptional regulator [Pseudomonas nitritireducens]MBB4867185.1 transcriptional regulator with XRE-family HTH domain [Pseudomonas nitritireducens]